jgi:hypothetical protein
MHQRTVTRVSAGSLKPIVAWLLAYVKRVGRHSPLCIARLRRPFNAQVDLYFRLACSRSLLSHIFSPPLFFLSLYRIQVFSPHMPSSGPNFNFHCILSALLLPSCILYTVLSQSKSFSGCGASLGIGVPYPSCVLSSSPRAHWNSQYIRRLENQYIIHKELPRSTKP